MQTSQYSPVAQWKYPAARAEWTEQAKLDLSKFDIEEDIQWIKRKSTQAFHKLAIDPAQEPTLEKNKRVGK